MNPFQLQRLGQIMEPEPGNPHEVEGVLNPAAARGPDGNLYLFPRLVAQGNYSRIGIAIPEMIFIGDAIFPGGNDYPAEEAGVFSIEVKDPHETKRVIEAIIARLEVS